MGGEPIKLEGSQPDGAHYECRLGMKVSRFLENGDYGPGSITMRDRARNESGMQYAYNHPVYEEPVTVTITTPTPDSVAPTLDISVCETEDLEEQCLRIDAAPMRPDNPDGETRVRIYYWAWEDQPLNEASGVSISRITLRNPQGQEFGWWHGDTSTGVADRSPLYWRNPFECPPYTLAQDPDCNATTPVQYVFEVILPRGSAPGIWGLTTFSVSDMAGNSQEWQFTETLRFDVE